MEASLVSSLGPSGARVAAFLSPLCGDDLAVASDLPVGWLSWSADVCDLGPNGPAQLLRWRESLWAGRPVPALPDAAASPGVWVVPPGPASGPAPPRTFASSHPRRPPNSGWIEVIAARRSISGAAVAVAFDEVFLEAATLARFNVAVASDPSATLFTFAARCEASGCSYLVPAVSLDTSVDVSRSPAFQDTPLKRIAQAAAELLRGPAFGADARAVRPPALLQAEAGVRVMLSSVFGSWKSYRAGGRCWSAFMDAFYPSRPHFPASFEAFQRFAPLFRNADTLRAYHGHIRFAERLFGLPHVVDGELWAALLRGARRFRVPAPRPRFLREDVLRLVRLAASSGHLASARLYAIARCWLSRVSAELIPLQLDGRRDLPVGDSRWHSAVTFRYSPDGAVRAAAIRLRTRKNAPFGERISRACSCGPCAESRLLCGPCALRGAASDHLQAGGTVADPVFGPAAALVNRFPGSLR